MKMASHWTYAAWLSVLRIFTGVFWLAHGVPKFLQPAAFMPPGGFLSTMVQQDVQTHHGLYHAFLVSVIVPNLALVAELIRLGEVLVGCALILGIFTRFAGFVGCLLAFNYFTMNGGFGSWTHLGSLDAAAFALSFMFLAVPAGRVAGVDALISRARVRVPRETAVMPEVVYEPPPQAPPG